MAVNIAKARDQLQWYGGLYTLVVSGIAAAKVSGKPVPVFAAVPVVVGGFMLCNMADMGNPVSCHHTLLVLVHSPPITPRNYCKLFAAF